MQRKRPEGMSLIKGGDTRHDVSTTDTCGRVAKVADGNRLRRTSGPLKVLFVGPPQVIGTEVQIGGGVSGESHHVLAPAVVVPPVRRLGVGASHH